MWADGYYAFDALNRMTTATENGTFVLATYLYDPLSRRTNLIYGSGTTQALTYSGAGDLLTLAHSLTGQAATYTNSFTKAHQLPSKNVSNAAWQYLPAVFETTNYPPANTLNQYVAATRGTAPTVTLQYDANSNLTGNGVRALAVAGPPGEAEPRPGGRAKHAAQRHQGRLAVSIDLSSSQFGDRRHISFGFNIETQCLIDLRTAGRQ